MFAGALCVVGAWAGCATTPTGAVATMGAEAAQIVIANLSDYAWKIEARPAEGRARSWQVLPRDTLQISLAGGEYVFTQTIVQAASPVASATREFPIRFETGERYEWSLATLLSAGSDEAATGPSTP